MPMKPEDVTEEHRKYLDISDNPNKPTNASIFVMLSDGLKKIDKMDDKMDKVDEKINGVKLDVAKLEVRTEERHKQQRREQAVLTTVVLTLLGFVLLILGIPVPVALP